MFESRALTYTIQGSITMMADILGDWREEMVTVLPGELRAYTTNTPRKTAAPV